MTAFTGDLNRSMQHLDSKYREEDVADEVQIEDLLQRRAEELDVGSLARFGYARLLTVFRINFRHSLKAVV